MRTRMTNGYPGSDKSVLLDVKGLKKYFPIRKGLLQRTVGLVKAVDDVTFFVNRGETLSLVGESGCGKTTTARCILRAITPTAGQVLLSDNGELLDVATVPKSKLRSLRRQMQMIFQDPFSSLNPRMTLLDIVGEPLLVHGVGNAQERTDRVVEMLRLVGLRPEYMRRYPHAFSGGQRPRIGVARALALKPRPGGAGEPGLPLGRRRRARFGAGRIRAGPDPEPDARTAGAPRADLPVRGPRPERRQTHQR